MSNSKTDNPDVGSDFRIWEGVYDEFPPDDTQGAFANQVWIDKQRNEATEALARLRMPKTGMAYPTATLVQEYPLPVLVGLIADGLDRPLRILDFGGGAATSYPAVTASIPAETEIEFHVVEVPELSTLGRELYADYANVQFHDSMPDASGGAFDIVHAAAALQYVNDWKGLLAQFAAYSPEWLAFGHLLAGPIQTFVTRQNIYGQQVPVRFLAMDEFLTELNTIGFKAVYHALMLRTILGREQPLPTDHFPPEHQLQYGCNMIFRRCGSGVAEGLSG